MADLIISTVERIYLEHPTTKIVLGEVTPCHNLDKEVVLCNTRLRERFRGESVQLVNWDYMRDDDWSYFKPDKKHVKVSATPFFAGAYIAALRRAHNLPQKKSRSSNGRPNRDVTGRVAQQSTTGYDNATPLMQNIIPPRNLNLQSQTSVPTYHNVPPPPSEPRRNQNTSSTLGTSLSSHPNQNMFTTYRTPSPPFPPPQIQVPLNQRTDGNPNRSEIGDRLKRLGGYPPSVQNVNDKRVLVETLYGILEEMKAWS